ncbi:tetratricopeptide repeat protein [Teladorsagia circumcincta]|uniref:Tetratricopeptide repeat protein n=1 Tax=Teladorsagia circumcincta TaxID=45464 RepID=A0A2G9TYA5_TELCI|nr:tetratricopeptide repeat protein [Teladorsagia circumcincta]
MGDCRHRRVRMNHSEEAEDLIQKEGVLFAESGHVHKAIDKFNEAIEKCPVNPSAFNNRAQALRLIGKPEEALADLNQAISLSNGVGRSACQAFVQRAMIHRLHGDDDSARADFQKAAELGSSFAKMQVVALNPYAAMCNKMLSEVFSNLKKGKIDQ